MHILSYAFSFFVFFLSCAEAKNEELLNNGFSYHKQGILKKAQQQYEKYLLYNDNNNNNNSNNNIATVKSLLGISFCQSDEIEKCVHVLTDTVEHLNPSDWVAWEYLGGSYSLLARRLYASLSGSSSGSSKEIEQEKEAEAKITKRYYQALEQAVRMFKKSLRLCEQQQAFASSSASVYFIQSHFAQARTNIYRNIGDSLLWLGKEEEARQLFLYAVEEKHIWFDPWCRPAENFLLKPLKERRCSSSSSSSSSIERSGGFCERSNFLYIIQPFENKMSEILAEYISFTSFSSTVSTTTSTTTGPTSSPLSALFIHERAGLHAGQKWKTLLLFNNGKQQRETCQYFPLLCGLVHSIPEIHINRGQVKFSVMSPSTHVLPHCGPTNNRLRMHCALVVPKGEEVWIKVANESRQWEEGKCFVFDESCEHEVRQQGVGSRVVLIVDFANPDLASFSSYLAAFQLEQQDLYRIHHSQLYTQSHQEL